MTGLCVYAAAVDGTSCDNGQGCAEVDACQAGVCVGTSLSAFSPGATLWTRPVTSGFVNTKYPDDQVSWSVTPVQVGSSGRALFGLQYTVPANSPFSPYGAEVFGVDSSGGVQGLAGHGYQGTCSANQSLDVRVFGAHYVIDSSFFPVGCGAATFYVDSDTGALQSSYVLPFSGPTLRATGNAAGDLLVSNASGIDLRRIDSTKTTIYTKSLGVDAIVQAGAAGDAYLGGTLSAGLDFGCGPIAGSGNFAARINPTGQCVWSRSVPSSTSVLLGSVHDYLKLSSQGTVDLGCGPVTSAAASTTFVAAIDNAGACLWSNSFGSLGTTVMPSGDLLLSGSFTGTLDLGCGPITSAPGATYRMALVNPAGACVWDRTLAAPNPSVVVNATGEIAVGAEFGGTINLGAGLLTSSGVQDLVVAKLDATNGTTLWSEHFGGAGATVKLYNPLRIDAGGGILVTGGVIGTANLGGGPITGYFGLRVDGAGAFRWQRVLDGSVGYDACGATVTVALTDTCANCGSLKTAGFTVKRIAP